MPFPYPKYKRPLAKVLLIKFWTGSSTHSTRKKLFVGWALIARPSYFCKRSRIFVGTPQSRFPTRRISVGKRHCRLLIRSHNAKGHCTSRFPTRRIFVGKLSRNTVHLTLFCHCELASQAIAVYFCHIVLPIGLPQVNRIELSRARIALLAQV